MAQNKGGGGFSLTEKEKAIDIYYIDLFRKKLSL